MNSQQTPELEEGELYVFEQELKSLLDFSISPGEVKTVPTGVKIFTPLGSSTHISGSFELNVQCLGVVGECKSYPKFHL
jgi:hypothetical protein